MFLCPKKPFSYKSIFEFFFEFFYENEYNISVDELYIYILNKCDF
jgi:hypothetical protein